MFGPDRGCFIVANMTFLYRVSKAPLLFDVLMYLMGRSASCLRGALGAHEPRQ